MDIFIFRCTIDFVGSGGTVMIKVTVVVLGGSYSKQFMWPVAPHIGEEISFQDENARVKYVHHRFEEAEPEIEVWCRFREGNDEIHPRTKIFKDLEEFVKEIGFTAIGT